MAECDAYPGLSHHQVQFSNCANPGTPAAVEKHCPVDWVGKGPHVLLPTEAVSCPGSFVRFFGFAKEREPAKAEPLRCGHFTQPAQNNQQCHTLHQTHCQQEPKSLSANQSWFGACSGTRLLSQNMPLGGHCCHSCPCFYPAAQLHTALRAKRCSNHTPLKRLESMSEE